MPLPRTTFTFDGAAQDQSRGVRHLPLGAFAELRNTRQAKRGELRKRRAFHRQGVTLTNLTTDAVTNGTAFDSLGWAGGAIYRDNRDNFWALNSARDTAYYRGNLPRLAPSVRAVGHTANKTKATSAVLAGNDLYVFSAGDTGTAADVTELYRSLAMSVFDAATGVRKAGPIEIMSGGHQAFSYAAVYDGTRYLWVFSVEVGRFVLANKVDTLAPAAAPTATTYYDGGADFVAHHVDAEVVAGTVYVVVSSYNNGVGKKTIIRHSKLNAGTGAESSGVNAVDYAPADHAVTCQIAAATFLEDQPGGTFGYFALWTVGSSDDKAALKVCKFNLSTLVVSSLQTVGVEFAAAFLGNPHAGLVSGYYDSSDGTAVLFSQVYRETITTYDLFLARDVFSVGGGTTVTTVHSRGAALASKPFKDTTSGRWYLLTQYDDSEAINLQRAWHVRSADRAGPITRNIVAQVGWGRGVAVCHMWRSFNGFTGNTFVSRWMPFTPAVGLLGGKFYAGIEYAGTFNKTAPQVLVLDTAAAWSPPAALAGDLLVYPGGVPQVVGPRDQACDLAVLMGPTTNPIRAAGTGADLGACLVTYCYRTGTSDGRITRSPFLPVPVSLVWKSAGTRNVTVGALHHIGRDGPGAEIEIWSTIPGGTNVHLQFSLPNDPTAATVTVAVEPETWTELGEPQPVGLVATPPPPCRVVSAFKERLYLTGTDLDGELWYSQPTEEGVGIELNAEGLRQVVAGGAINAAAAIDWNSMALFRRDGITVIQGTGPTGNGGAYETVGVHGAQGVEKTSTSGDVVVSTSQGVYFQSAGNARIQLLTPGLQVVEASQGIDATVTASLLTAGLEVVSDGATWVQFADGTTAALDHRNPTDQAPLGQIGAWHAWASAALTAASAYSVGLVDAGGTPIWLSADGAIRRPKTSLDPNPWDDDTSVSIAAVLTRWKSGKVAPAGPHVEVYASEVQLLGTHVGAADSRLTITNDDGTAETHDVTTSSPLNYAVRPGNCLRTQELELQFEELTPAGATTEGPVWDGFAVEFRPQGQKRLATGRVF